MRRFSIIGFLVWVLMAGSCSRVQYIPVETVRVDSISFRDTVFQQVLVPYRDSVTVSDTVSFLTNPYAFSWARWQNGQLSHSLSIYPFATVMVRVPYYIDRYVRITEPKIVEVEKKLSRWQRIKLELGGLSMGAWVICIALQIVRWLWHKGRK